MRIPKLPYVFSFLFILFIGLSEPGFAQNKGKIQKGSATWYGSKYHGRKTTSGEVYNKNHMTAAHPSLPFGTKVKVTSLADNKSVIVRINDRGPFGKKGYIIDLSEAAAKKIQLYRPGYGKVSVEVLSPSVALEDESENEEAPETIEPMVAASHPATETTEILATDSPYFVIQAGAFADAFNAKLQSDKLKALDRNLPIILSEEMVQGKKVHRVVAGHFASRAAAEALKSRLVKKGITAMVKQMPAHSSQNTLTSSIH